MIDSLTREQEAQIEVYRKKFLEQGLSTARLDVPKALKAIKSLYEALDLKLELEGDPNVEGGVQFQVFDSPQAMCEFAAENCGGKPEDYVSKMCLGNVSNYWVSFYSFVNNVLNIKAEEDKVRVAEEIAEHCGPFLMFENAILLSQRPTAIHILDDMVTRHCETGPAIDHADGKSQGWFLNNIEVPSWVVTQKPEEFTKEQIMQEENADTRREIVRKVGPERLLQILDYKTIDTMDEYELITFDIGDDRQRPFLKFTCTSTGLTHIHGVSPEVINCREALAWKYSQEDWKRPHTEDEKVFSNPLTDDFFVGMTVQRHGDVHLKKWDAFDTRDADILTQATVHVGKNNNHDLSGGKFQLVTTDEGKFLNVIEETNFVHNEHGKPAVPVGFYKVYIDREYDHWLEESREVID